MKINFDKNAGELLDLFWSLYYMANYDFVQSEMKKLGIELNLEMEQEFLELVKAAKIENESLGVFFNRETKISEALVHMDEVFNTTLDDLLSAISKLQKEEILERLIIELTADRIESEDERIKEAAKIIAQNGMLEFIKSLEISASAKWNLFCFIDDIEGQIKGFADLVRSYSKVYFSELKKHKKAISEFNNIMEKRIKADPEAFLMELTRGSYKAENYETILFSTTYFYAYNLFFKTTGKLGHLIVGIDFEKAFKSLEGQNELENMLAVFKNLSDKTRFEIIRLLLARDYFGQELADELKITSATVSYHMNFLMSAKLIHVERKEHKAYYTLNKEALRACIGYLNREFKL